MPTKRKLPTRAELKLKEERSLYRRRSSALTLLQAAARWQPFYSASGVLLWRLPSERSLKSTSEPAEWHTVYVGATSESCSCPFYGSLSADERAQGCKHLLSVRAYMRVSQARDKHLRAMLRESVG
jgi:hypothetical protein